MKILMLRDEIVNTTKGPIRFFQGDKPDVDSGVASSLIGRGYAIEVPQEEVKAIDQKPLHEWTVEELRIEARNRSIPGYSLMRKTELVEALSGGE